MLIALALAVPLAVVPADSQPQTPPEPATAPMQVKLDCVVQSDQTVRDCVITNMPSVDRDQDQALQALHAIEAKSTPVPNGKPGDKVHIVMTRGS